MYEINDLQNASCTTELLVRALSVFVAEEHLKITFCMVFHTGSPCFIFKFLIKVCHLQTFYFKESYLRTVH